MDDRGFMIGLQPVKKQELEEFKKGVQEAFGKAVIVQFINKYHPDPHACPELPEGEAPVGCDEAFFFEKIMKGDR